MYQIVGYILVALTVFNFIYLIFLTTNPREFRDINGNTDFIKIFGASFFVTVVLFIVYVILLSMSRVGWKSH
jgi:ABC-type Na+ efflux pump permease subunit